MLVGHLWEVDGEEVGFEGRKRGWCEVATAKVLGQV